MNNFKIAFCNRPSYDNPLGGDAIQMLETKKYLEKKWGLQIDIITDPKLITSEYSIVHVFNFLTYKITRRFIERAHSLNIPIVSSCIYWDYSYAGTYAFFDFWAYPTHINKWLANVLHNILKIIGYISPKPAGISSIFRGNVRKFIKMSTYIAPNSDEEGKLLIQFANCRNIPHNKFCTVFNGVQLDSKSILPENIFFKKYDIPHKYILQVGRIEYLKNQLNLLYALRNNSEIPIVFVGQIYSKTYYKKVKKLANKRGNVFFINKVDHNDIASFYKYASLHVLLSMRESPGLVNLEAASLQCPIVVSDERFLPLNTYFPNTPYVVDPFNIAQIREVILRAYSERKITNVNLDDFSWENVAKQTYQIYNKILKNEL